MNRRSFLSLFGSAAAVAAVRPTYFFAPVGGWKQLPRYSFKDVKGLYAPDVSAWTAPVEDDFKRMLRESGLMRRPACPPIVRFYTSMAEVERDFGRSIA